MYWATGMLWLFACSPIDTGMLRFREWLKLQEARLDPRKRRVLALAKSTQPAGETQAGNPTGSEWGPTIPSSRLYR